ncbi:tripartite motif-containing protein 66 [Mytilus galloprovincialis]|uniref:Tripartite motif-containing protein 66 n=1 Tax=Mytilus galloprovincialis TaxID=29158 RepID=A0A8B6E4G5_MYTGA|nr:tripartite motif-containing protein 66 [Mytilus galloprovincialis]
MAQSFVKCEICDKRECALICLDCDQYFCQECKEGHLKTKTTKDHTFFDSGTFQPQYKKLRCTQHEQHFIFFCERCQTLVCSICLPENHQEHRMLKIDEVASSKKKVLNETIKTFVTKLNEFEAEVNSVQNSIEKGKEVNEDVIQHVNKQSQDISKVLENQKRIIIDSLKQKAKQETEITTLILTDLQHCLKEAKEVEGKVKSHLTGSDTSLLSHFQLLSSYIDKFKFKSTSISICPVQLTECSVQTDGLSTLESIIRENLCVSSEHKERLISAAGEKLTKGHPSITDLGDPNRPMKISEKYGELYDNEWTDALDNNEAVKKYYHGLNGSEIEEVIICHLHKLLTCCYKDCLAKADEQINIIGKTFAETMCITFNSVEEVLNLPVCKEASVFRKAKSVEFAKFLFENQNLCRNVMNDWNYNYKNEKVMQLLMTSPFFEKCVNICWSMAIQDPVMYLDEDVPVDTQIDKNTYKEFVKNGNTVAFVVWPALFLHKDGPLLYKGVVQAYWK